MVKALTSKVTKPLFTPGGWLLLSVLLISGLLRAASAGQYLFQDERPIILNALAFASDRTIVPRATDYPAFFSYVATIPLYIAVGVGWLFGEFASLAEVEIGFFSGNRIFYLPVRGISVVAAVASTYLIYRIGVSTATS